MWVSPDDLVVAAQRLTDIESDLAAANATAARSITTLAAAAQDEVSQSLASMFSEYGQQTQVAVAQHGVIGTQQFTQGIASAASSYSSAEAFNLDLLLAPFAPYVADLVKLAQTNPLAFITVLAGIPLFVTFLLSAIPLAIAFGIGLSLIVLLFSPR